MWMKHTVKLRSGALNSYYFRTKKASDEAFINSLHLNATFNTIKCIWIEPEIHPEKRIRIDFDERGYQI